MKKFIAGVVLAVALLAGCVPTPPNRDDRVPPETPPYATAETTETPVPEPTSTTKEPTPEPSQSQEPTAAPTTTAPEPEPTTQPSSAGTALAALATLDEKGRAPKTGYDRELFGPAWEDVDRNGCDTRNDILRRDLTHITTEPNGCIVLTGVLADPFTAKVINFTRGQATSREVQIDHIVPLSLAWQTGAQQMSAGDRIAFANDPLNLLAVDGSANASKSDSDAASWLPPNKSFRCEYVALQIAVKAKYGLWVTAPEKDAMERVLASCPNQPLPDQGSRIEVKDPVVEKPTQAPTQQTTAPSGNDSTDPRFGTCKEAKANGYGPYTKGQDAEYEWYRDADKDGKVCE